MRHKDPELMKRISQFVKKFYENRGRMPSTAEIAAMKAVSQPAVKKSFSEYEKSFIS